jgi:hypothetical protein
MWIDTERENTAEWLVFFIWTIPTCVGTLLSIILARVFLTRPHLSLRRMWQRAAAKVAGGKLNRDSWKSLRLHPILWRHCRGTLLSSPPRLLAIGGVLVCIGIALWFVFPESEYSSTFGGSLNEFDALTVTCGGLAALFFLVKGTSAVAAERSQQTLDVLLTTPMPSPCIVLEKAAVLWRGSALVLPLLGTLLLLSALTDSVVLWRVTGVVSYDRDTWFTIAAGLLTIVCYSFALLWVFLWLGLRIRNRRVALLTGLGILSVAVSLAFFASPVEASTLTSWWLQMAWRVISPADFQLVRQSGQLISAWGAYAIPLMAAHFFWITAVGFIFRRLSLRRADVYLGRVAGGI